MVIGEMVILEEISPHNIEQLRRWRNLPDLRDNFRQWKDISVDQQIKWYSEFGNNTNNSCVYFQIMSKNELCKNLKDSIDKRYLIGSCALSAIDWRLRNCEFSIFISPEFQGAGKGKDALSEMLKFAFNEMNMHKVWGEVFERNQSAYNMYLKMGFKLDGRNRDSNIYHGKYEDSLLISILKSEWLKNG